MEVGLGPGHIVLDGDPAPTKKGHTPTFRPIFIVAKWLDGSRCHLVPKVVLGPSNIVFDVDPAPLLPPKGQSPQFSAYVYGKEKERTSIYIAPFCTKVHTKRSGMDNTV